MKAPEEHGEEGRGGHEMRMCQTGVRMEGQRGKTRRKEERWRDKQGANKNIERKWDEKTEAETQVGVEEPEEGSGEDPGEESQWRAVGED